MIIAIENRDGSIAERKLEFGTRVTGIRAKYIKLEYGDIPKIVACRESIEWFSQLSLVFRFKAESAEQ